MPKRITSEDRQAVLDLHKAGTSRNQIVRETGVSAGMVTKIIHDAGGSFDRTATVKATEAKKADLAKKRADLEEILLDDAMKLRARIWEEREYRQAVGGMEPTVMLWTQSEPAAADQLKLMQAAGAAIDRSLKIGQNAKDDGSENVKSMLGSLFEHIQHRAGPDPDQPEEMP